MFSVRIFTEWSADRKNHGVIRLTLWVVATLGVGQGAMAQVSDAVFFAEIPMAVSATRIPQMAEESPVWTTVIDRQMIKATGAVELADVLRLVPGMQVTKVGGNWPIATYHGMSDFQPRRMQVLVDGRSVYLSTFSNTDWPFLGVELSDVERIEVVQGSDAAVHGSNAFIGTINIITRQPFEQQGVYFSVTDGTAETRNTAVRMGTTVGPWSVRATGSWRSDEGFSGRDDSQQLHAFTLRASSDVMERDAWNFQTGYSGGTQSVLADGEALDPSRSRDVTNTYVQGNWRRMLGDNSELSVQYYHNYYRTDDRFTVPSLAGVLGLPAAAIPTYFGGHEDQPLQMGVFDGIGNRDDIEIQHLYLAHSNFQIAWGGGLRLDQFKSKIWLAQTDAVWNRHVRAFGQISWRASSDLVANVGGLMERNTTTGFGLSWRGSLNYALGVRESVRLSVARSVRSLSLLESRANWGTRFDDGSLIDQHWLSPGGQTEEKLTAYEIGYHRVFSGSRWTFDGKLFEERFRDLNFGVIDKLHADGYIEPLAAVTPELESTRGATLTTNNGHATLRGAELSLRWRPGPNDFFMLQYSRASANGEFLKRIKLDGSHFYETLNTTVPDHTLSMLASHAMSSSVLASAAFYRITAMEWIGDGDLVPGYNRIDLRLGKTFRLGSAKAELAGMVHNLFQPYAEFVTENVFERRVYLQLSIQD